MEVRHKTPADTQCWRIWAIMLKQMAVLWTLSVYLHDRQAKQSERSLHSRTVPWCWNWSKEKMECVSENCFVRQRSKTGRMCVYVCVPLCVFVCRHAITQAWASALECVCCRPWQSVCFWVCVQGCTFTRTMEGCLTSGSQFKQWDTPLFHPLIQVAVRAFPWS